MKLLSDYTDSEESTSVITTRELDESSLGLPGDQTLSRSHSLPDGSSSKETTTDIPDPDSDKLSDKSTSDDDDDSPENCISPVEGHTLNSDPAQGNLVTAQLAHCKLTSTCL